MDTPTLPPVGAGAPISARSKNREPRPLIGEFIRRPEWLWLTHVAPIGLLLAWAGHTYWLVQSELNAGQRAESLVLAAALVFIMCGAGVMSLLTQRAGRLLGERQCAGLLLMSLAVLGMGLRFCWFTIPWSVPEWLANQTELLFESFCLGMPGAFYAILVLISRPLRRHGGKEFGILVGVTVLGALGFYGVFYLLAETNRFLQLPEWAGMLLALVGVFAGGTAITALITRATLITYAGVRRTRPAFQRCFIFLVAVCGPIGGLYLNKTIPFPVDLQAPVIYLLALLNGAVLMLPVVRSLFWHRVIWLAQCLLFPFSAYFFILFLPFLPLSLFAMIVAGAGFLVLVPLVLGITHTCRLADGLREEIRDGRAWPVAVMGLCAVLVLPAVGLWSTWRDREALDEALTYIYSPDYRKDITYPG
ncbi:MAG TPA: MSEP-CTERM sorting domain-containing protein, partial [Candidatus Methylacidiphilales bacterium]|nr:MSEP-CTERM sorting domain-containing protein [Candidatus Methylacidiphilales bacterium]